MVQRLHPDQALVRTLDTFQVHRRVLRRPGDLATLHLHQSNRVPLAIDVHISPLRPRHLDVQRRCTSQALTQPDADTPVRSLSLRPLALKTISTESEYPNDRSWP